MFRVFIFALILSSLLFSGTALALTAALDPGHGGFETGFAPAPRYEKEDVLAEKELDFQIALATAKALGEKGIKCWLTRDSDRYMGISERAEAAQSKKPSIFISVHESSGQGFNIYSSYSNAAGDDPAAYYGPLGRQRPFTAESEKLAKALRKSLEELFPGREVSYRVMPLPILNEIAAPALLLEVPNSSYLNYSGEDAKKLIAAAIAAGVESYEKGGNGTGTD
jgi:N-acetylmuramoyl-L-alanine amidase